MTPEQRYEERRKRDVARDEWDRTPEPEREDVVVEWFDGLPKERQAAAGKRYRDSRS